MLKNHQGPCARQRDQADYGRDAAERLPENQFVHLARIEACRPSCQRQASRRFTVGPPAGRRRSLTAHHQAGRAPEVIVLQRHRQPAPAANIRCGQPGPPAYLDPAESPTDPSLACMTIWAD